MPNQEPEMPKTSNHRPTRKTRRAKQSSCIYRVRNWSAYDRALKQRGSVTLWCAPEAVAAWNYQGAAPRGAQFVYSDLAIETALTLRLIYHLPLRQTEGFVESLLHLMGLDLSAPDHSTLSRWQKGLPVDVPTRPAQEPIHLVVDSSGLKVYGEGEWKVRQHGWSVRRTWRKLHLGVNEATGEIIAQTLTKNSVDDAAQVAPLLGPIDAEVARLGGDGSYDKHKVFKVLADLPHQGPIEPIIALRKAAKIQQHGNCKAPRRPAMRFCGRSATRGAKAGNNKGAITAARWLKRRCFAISRSSATNCERADWPTKKSKVGWAVRF